MRVVQVGPDGSRPGGIRTVMLTLKDSSLGNQFNIDIVPTSSKTHRISTFLRGFQQLKRLVKHGDCDCVHIHMSENASVYRTAAITHWVKTRSHAHVIIQSHGSSVQGFFARCPKTVKRALTNCLEMADLFVVLTPGWERWWKKVLPKMRYEIIPNAVRMPSCENAKNTEQDDTSVLFMGQLGERKGTYLLISAIPEVLAKHPDVRFVFAGDGEIKRCSDYADNLGVLSSCKFMGWAGPKEKNSLFKEASMLVLPSKEESFGIVLLEAMSYEVPVICSDGGFMHEVVDNGKDGIVFSSGDKVALASAICSLLEKPEHAQKMGYVGRCKVEKYYKLSVVIEKWEAVYSEVHV